MTVVLSSLVSRTRWLDDPVDPLSFLDGSPDSFAWLHDGAGFATSGVVARVRLGTGTGRLGRAAAEAAAVLGAVEVDDEVGLAGTGPLAVGAVPFADGRAGELVVPARVVGRTRDGRSWITEVSPLSADVRVERPDPAPAPADPRRVVVSADGGRGAYCRAVAQALERIDQGSLAKVVLARQVVVEADVAFAVAEVVARLRADHPSCFTFTAGGFVGSSPELLARRRGRRVTSRPMAGSVGRAGSPAEDDRLIAGLASSAKDLSEHGLVVEAVRAALEPVCDQVTVGSHEVVRLATVAHLASTVAGHLRDDRSPSALALAGLLHPTPAVGGLPRPAALAAIAELEGFDRGLYAGPVGWVDRKGDGEFAVALRCAHLEGRRAVLAAGAGIVAGSDPDAEWAETQAKLEPMLRALVRV